MALGRYRTRITAKGLGKLEVMQTAPTPDSDFLDAGWLDQQGTEILDAQADEVIKDENGRVTNVLQSDHAIKMQTSLLQTSIDEMNLIRRASGRLYAIRYSGSPGPGMAHYYCFEQARISPSMPRGYKPSKQLLPFTCYALNQEGAIFIPEYYLIETAGKISTTNLRLYQSPRSVLVPYPDGPVLLNVLDASGWANHGTLAGGVATTFWQGPDGTPNYFLRYDGVNDLLSIPSVQGLEFNNGANDVPACIEIWARIQGANGTQQILCSKRDAMTAGHAGYALYRKSDNKIYWTAGAGGSDRSVVSTATLLQNVWTHIAFVFNPSGTCQLYINGVADGAAVDLSAYTFGSTAHLFAIAATCSSAMVIANNSQIDGGDTRFYQFPAASLPADQATRIANHFAAERGYYGI